MKRTKFNIVIATGMVFTLLFAGCSANGNAANNSKSAVEASKSASAQPDTKEITDVKERLKNDALVQDFQLTKESDRVVAVINFKSGADTKSVNMFIADYSGFLKRAYKTNSADMKIMQDGKVITSVTVQ